MISGVGTVVAGLTAVASISSPAIAGTGGVNASLSAVVHANIAATLTGTGTVSTDLYASYDREALLTGAGTVSADLTYIEGAGAQQRSLLKVRNIVVRSFSLDYLDIYWETEPSYEDPLDYYFVVEKSQAEFGPFYDLTKKFRDRYALRDSTVRNQHSFYNKQYYRIRVENISTGATSVFPITGAGVALGAPPDLIAIEVARLFNIELQEFSGRKLWLFPKKKWGTRCSCYDAVTQRKIRSNCLTCFDTSWSGGFFAPIEVWGKIQSQTENTSKSQLAEIEIENGLLTISNYPEVHEGWIVVEPDNTRWRIGSTINRITKGRAVVKQMIPIHRIPKSDIEYSLPINVDVEELISAPVRNFTNPQNLDYASSVVRPGRIIR